MSEFKLPHVEDLATNSKLPGQLTEDMKAIERAINDIHGEIDSEEQDRKSEDNRLDGRIDNSNARLDNLDKQKATHDEVKNVQEAWKKKIEHVALGTDYETVEQAVMQILKEKGMI